MRWAVLVWSLMGLCAHAQEPGAATPARSPYELGFMVLAVLFVLVSGSALWRLLAQRRIVTRFVWILPIFVVLSGAVALVVHQVAPTDFANLRALLLFLFGFTVFLSLLYPVARIVLPARQKLTRGGVPPLLRGAAIAVVAFAGLLVLLSWCFPGLSLTPMFVTSGIVSLVLGFALQDMLGNLVAGLVLGVEQSFQLGDWIRVGETEGEVVALTWRTVTLRTRENDAVVVPNNLVAREGLHNYHRPTVEHLCRIRVGVAYATPCGVATAALLEAAASVEEVLRHPPPEVHLKDFGDSGVIYELRAWIDNYESAPAIESDLRRQIWYAFKRHGITIPFPQRDVNFRQITEPATTPTAQLVAVAGPLRGSVFPLGNRVVSIGRNPDCDVVIADQHVSGRHAVVEPRGAGYLVRDLESRHGTLLNGRGVREARLEQGDELSIGPVTLVYETHALPAGLEAAARIVPAVPGVPPENPDASRRAAEA